MPDRVTTLEAQMAGHDGLVQKLEKDRVTRTEFKHLTSALEQLAKLQGPAPLTRTVKALQACTKVATPPPGTVGDPPESAADILARQVAMPPKGTKAPAQGGAPYQGG